MKITGGTFRSRLLAAPQDNAIRPTADMVRQAVFNKLATMGLPDGAVVLDAFCGTGALGLEALSRGASFCAFMDNNRDSIALCRENIASLAVSGQSAVLQADALKPGKKPESVAAADLVFLDPPYGKNFLFPALAALADQGWLAAGAVCVAECEKELSAAAPEEFTLLDDRAYGRTRILFYRR